VSRRLSSVAAVLLLSWGAWMTDEVSDPLHGISRADLDLVGNVAIVMVEKANMLQGSSGPVEGSRFPVETMTFGKDGLLQEWAQYKAPRGLASTRSYTYADGLLVQEEAYTASGALSERIEYTHEEGGKRTTATVRSGTKALRKTVVYERDADGKLQAVSEFDAAGGLASKIVYTYPPKEERADRYDAEGKLLSWSVKAYDAKGQLSKVSLYSQGAESSPFLIAYEYDGRGNVTLEETSGQLSLGFFVITPPPTARKTSYEYTYDETGNWVKRVESTWVPREKDPYWQSTAVTYRTFVYYK